MSMQQATEMIQKSVRDAGLLVKAARTGDVEIWRIVLEELTQRGLRRKVKDVEDQRQV